MKYFFISSTDSSIYVLAAHSIENARKIAEKSGIAIDALYELKEDTFKNEGFLVTDEAKR